MPAACGRAGEGLPTPSCRTGGTRDLLEFLVLWGPLRLALQTSGCSASGGRRAVGSCSLGEICLSLAPAGGMPEWSGGHVRTCSHSCTGTPKVLSGSNNSSPFLSSLHKHTTVREKISSARLPLLLSWRHSLTAAGSRADLCPQVVLREARLISLLTVGAEVQEY